MPLEDKWLWLAIFMGVYFLLCLYWSVRGAVFSKTPARYFLDDRATPHWIAALALTVASFSAVNLLAHPALIYKGGFQYGFLAFYAIVVPLSGILFFKRLWTLAKRFGFITPGELLSTYFQSPVIRLITVLIGVLVCLPYLALQLRASGFLFSHLTDNALPFDLAIYIFAFILFIYSAMGGLRAISRMAAIQCLLFIVGVLALGGTVFYFIGDYAAFSKGLVALIEIDTQRTAEGTSHLMSLPLGFGSENPISSFTGEGWSAVLLMTLMLGFLGIQATPNFVMFACSSREPSPFSTHQVWLSAILVGVLLTIVMVFIGIGSHFLGANSELLLKRPDLINNEIGFALQANGVDSLEDARGGIFALVPYLINLLADQAPWLVGLIGICALSVLHATGAVFLFTTGSLISRDVLTSPLSLGFRGQKNWARLAMLFLIIGGVYLAAQPISFMMGLISLALGLTLLMWPSLLAVCYIPWFTRMGIISGFVTGFITVLLTEPMGQIFLTGFDVSVPWQPWPLSIHSAVWGLIINLFTVVMVSAISQTRARFDRHMIYHHYLRQHAGVASGRKSLIPLAWIVVLVWFFFGTGPGAVVGNWIFGDPQKSENWMFGIPSLWAWQIAWFVFGVFMVWLLAKRIGLSESRESEVAAFADDFNQLKPDFSLQS